MLNKQAALTVPLIFILFAGLVNLPVAKAWETISTDSSIQFYMFTLLSPLNGTYNSPFLDLNLTFSSGAGIKYTINYYIDGKFVGTIPYTIENSNELHVVYPATAYGELPPLSQGSHSLTVVIDCKGLIRSLPSNRGTVYFTIDSKSPEHFIPQPIPDLTPPKITNLYAENQTSNQTRTQLFFQIDEPRKIQNITYSIDKEENKTLPSDTMMDDFGATYYFKTNLTGLTGGFHNITVYATDAAGNIGASETVIFHVDTPENENSDDAVVPAAILSFSVIAVGALGFLGYKKRKHCIVNDISLGKLG
jgi:hypothetical protein